MAEDEGITYEMLQDLLRSERRTNKLMPIPASFWPRAQDYLAAATEAFRVEQARDPFGREVIQLTDRVKNARHAAASLWALRERKLAMLALAQTPKGKVPDGATPDETELYANFLGVLAQARGRVLGDMQADAAPRPAQPIPARPNPVPAEPHAQQALPHAPTAPPVEPAETHANPLPPAPPVPLAEPVPRAPALQVPVIEPPMARAPLAPAPTAAVTVPGDVRGQTVSMVTIRALGDIPAFVGPDMQTYLLKSGDVASVPQSIANLLARRKKAAIIEM